MPHDGYQHWDESVYDIRPSDGNFDVHPSERIGAFVPSQSRSRIVLRLVCAVTLTLAWFAAVSSPNLERIASEAKPVLATIFAKAQELAGYARMTDDVPKAPAAEGPLEPMGAAAFAQPGEDVATPPLFAALPPHEERRVPSAEDAPADEPAEPVGTAYTDTVDAGEEEPPEKRAKRKQAVDAGLGVDLPNVLVTRLSAEDFKNARHAIATAIAKTADDATFVWPRAPSRKQAQFEVRFVVGAAPGCRRYVVTVTKDRWSSTSAALEKCGAHHARAS